MYEISEQFGFVATHELGGASTCHPHPRVHLHRWTVDIVLVAALLPPANHPSELVELEPVRRYIARELDGRYLNDVLPDMPTPTNIAVHLARWCQANLTGFAATTIFSVGVSTGPDSKVRLVMSGRSIRHSG